MPGFQHYVRYVTYAKNLTRYDIRTLRGYVILETVP